MRLDWDVYIQTRDRELEKFSANPEVGKSRIFRGVIFEDVATNFDDIPEGSRLWRFYDTAYPSPANPIRVPVMMDSKVGKTLEPLTWIGLEGRTSKQSTVTLELSWAEGDIPRLEITDIICWEFLGVGGDPSNLEAGPSI